jgi:signal peptidase I
MRFVLFRILAFIAAVVLIAVGIKAFVADTYVMRSDHMQPTLLTGDRILVSRIAVAPPVRVLFPLTYRQSVIYRRVDDSGPGCLHIAGMPGDTVVIDKGRCITVSRDSMIIDSVQQDDVIASRFSQRDHMPAVRLPQRGDTARLDTLPMRTFFFYTRMVRDENPSTPFRLAVELTIDSVPYTDSVFTDFTVYTGTLDTLPDSLKNDYTFWKRLAAYLQYKDLTPYRFSYRLLRDGVPVERYVWRDSYYFLMGEDWRASRDSRYFGPVSARNITASVVCVLWSRAPSQVSHGTRWRFNRCIKLIH